MLRTHITILASSFGVITPLSAAVLTFDTGNTTDGSGIPTTYGDNITATTIGSSSYGATGGFTPDITVSYGNASHRY